MQVSFEDFQKALIDGRINIHQFLEVLVDNFGQKKAMDLIEKNLKPYLKKENYVSPNFGNNDNNNFPDFMHN